MQIFKSLLTAALLVTGTLAAKKTSADRFNDFHAKALKASPVTLTETSWKSLTKAPRDYNAAVLLTAMGPRFGCTLCREFQPEWELLGHSWAKGDKKGESRTIFATLDFADGRDVFMSLGLQTAPVLLLFPPTTGPNAAASPEPIRYDFSSGPPTAEQIHDWIARQTPGPHPPVKRPFDYVRWGSVAIFIFGAISALAVGGPYILPIIQNRNIWASISLIAILLFTSGHMFNHIRKVPYVTGDGKGGVNYFANGFQTQFGLETQIVAAIYGVLAFCTITLAVKAPRMEDARTQQVAVFIYGGVMYLVYSFLLSVFRVKNGGYPFAMPPFM